MIRRRLAVSLGALSVAFFAAAEVHAQAPAGSSEERLQKQIDTQQADLAEQETRVKDLEKKLRDLTQKLKDREGDQAPPAPTGATAPPTQPAAAATPTALDKLLPEFFHDLQVSGYIQAQYESHQDSQDQLDASGNPLNLDRFTLRRGRVKLQKDWEYTQFMFEVDGNTVNGPALNLHHAEASVLYRGNRKLTELPVIRLTFGQFDTPFGYELVESPKTRYFMERSLMSRALWPGEPDVGARLTSALGWFRASVAIINGSPLGLKTGVGFPLRTPLSNKDFTARMGADFRILKWLGIAGGASVYSGKGFTAGTLPSKSGFQWNDVNQDGTVGPGELQAVSGSSATPSQSFTRWAVGTDLRANVEAAPGWRTDLGFEFIVASNMDRGLYVANPVPTGLDVREIGYELGLTQEIYHYGVLGFRYDQYNPNADSFTKQQGQLVPGSLTVNTYSPLFGFTIPDRGRLLFQYDMIRNNMGLSTAGAPTNLKDDTWTLRLQVNL